MSSAILIIVLVIGVMMSFSLSCLAYFMFSKNSLASTVSISPCIPKPGWMYKKQVKKGAKYVCPTGYVENNKCSNDSSVQCQKRAKKGKWESPVYGGTGGKTSFKSECDQGHYVSGLTLFHGDYDTNAIFATCYDPTGATPQYPLFKSEPDYIYGNHDTPANAGQFFQSAVDTLSMGMITTGGSMKRKTHPSVSLNDVAAGFHRWEVNPQKEIKGLKMYARDGRDTGWAGGTKSGAAIKVENGKCPEGKVVTGIQGRAGDRVDAIGFICDAPQT